MRLLDYPDAHQRNSDTCGAAAAQGILRYYGVDMYEDDVLEELRPGPDGVEAQDIVRLLRSEGLTVDAARMTPADVAAWVDRGVPVLMPIQAWADPPTDSWEWSIDEGHWVVAIGHDGDRLIFDDPSLMGNRGWLSFGDLATRWCMVGRDRKLLRNVGLAVHGRPPSYRSEDLVHIRSAAFRVASRWLLRDMPRRADTIVPSDG